MKKLTMFLVMVSVLFLGIPTFAGIPNKIQFQGKATDDEGMPLSGEYIMKFRIYATEQSTDPIWYETYEGTNKVLVEKGVFSVLLGEVSSLDIPFDNSYWISLEIGTTDRTNELPRQPISSVGYAYTAKTAETLSVQTQDLNMGGYKITNVADPVDPQDVATKSYVGNLAAGMPNREVFTLDGTWTCPADVTTVYLTMVGGGAGGGATSSPAGYDAGGGGGGASCMKIPYTVAPLTEYTIQVGMGGEGVFNSAGEDGGDTIFNTTSAGGGYPFIVPGGNGGGQAGGGFGTPGTGGEGGWDANGYAGGTMLFAGGNGANVGGGGSLMGKGGDENLDGTGYGAGGSGNSGTESNAAGFDGTDGIVIIEW